MCQVSIRVCFEKSLRLRFQSACECAVCGVYTCGVVFVCVCVCVCVYVYLVLTMYVWTKNWRVRALSLFLARAIARALSP